MGLDIFVMPLWRFKAGDFRSPIELSMGIRPKIVTAEGVVRRPESVGWLDRWRSRRQVAAIRRAVQKANRTPVRWRDEGDQVYAAQAGGMEPLQAYARWLDHRDLLPEFESMSGDYDKHPALILESERPPSCPHLAWHSLFSGYFLPCEFDQVIEVEPFLIAGYWPAAHAVGSSPRLRGELARIEEHLQVPDDFDDPDDPLRAVKYSFRQLKEVADLSCRHALPIIFWG